MWKQDVDGIELWDDVAHNQGGAEVIGEVVSLPQCFVRCGGEIGANQDGSLELHGHSAMKGQRQMPPYRTTAYSDTWRSRSILALASLDPDGCVG